MVETGANQEKQFFGELLKHFRQRKKLTQQQLAEKIEVTRETVSLWERGNYKPEAEGILYQIVDVLGLTVQEQMRLFEAYTVTALATSFHHPPSKRNPYFTGRGAQLAQLHTLLIAGKQVALTQAISGLGGIGKTQLALEYAYRYQKSYHDIFWAYADTEEALLASYVRFAEMLHLPETKEADQNKVKEAVRRWFQTHTNWLLVLDNIEDLRLLPSFVPENRQGAVLLTTRKQVTEPAAQALELEVLPEEEALLFLLKRTKVLSLDASLEDASYDEREAARAISRLLDNLPLALDQAGAYILETTCSFAEYAALFQTHREHLLQRRIGENIPTDHPNSVTTTFTLNFEQVQQRNPAAADLLRLCSFLAPDRIPEELFRDGAAHWPPLLQQAAMDHFTFNQMLEELLKFSLMKRLIEEQMLSVHRLVQAVQMDRMEPDEQRHRAEWVVRAMNSVFPQDARDVTMWPRCLRYLEQVQVCDQLIQQYSFDFLEGADVLHRAGLYLTDHALYVVAETLLRRALHIRERQEGLEHPHIATSLTHLANLYSHQGKYGEAEQFCQRALPILEQHLGPEHPQVARALSLLGDICWRLGKHDQAKSLDQRALSIFEQQLGETHPYVATQLNALAILYREQGKYDQAEPLYRRALSIYEQQLGRTHLKAAYPLNGLAILYHQQGKYQEAEPLYQRALSIFEQQLSETHPLVATSLNGLALLYAEQGKDDQAEPLYQQAISIWEQRLGPDNAGEAYPLTNLAKLYCDQGKYIHAEALYQRALHIREQQLGPEHLQVAYPLHGLANLYWQQGKYVEAESLYQRALSIREQQVGPDHPDTAATLHDVAVLREQQGNRQEALVLYQRALSIREQALGQTHPRTRATHERLTALRERVGHEAGALFEDGISPEQRR